MPKHVLSFGVVVHRLYGYIPMQGSNGARPPGERHKKTYAYAFLRQPLWASRRASRNLHLRSYKSNPLYLDARYFSANLLNRS